MHNLQVIKNACIEAMEGDEDNRGGLGLFRAIVDPESVWEMARIIEVLVDRLEKSGIDPALVDQVRKQLRGGQPLPGQESAQ